MIQINDDYKNLVMNGTDREIFALIAYNLYAINETLNDNNEEVSFFMKDISDSIKENTSWIKELEDTVRTKQF